MPDEEAMFKDVTTKTAALSSIAPVILSTAFQRVCAQEQGS
jgi:hypothetical protein